MLVPVARTGIWYARQSRMSRHCQSHRPTARRTRVLKGDRGSGRHVHAMADRERAGINRDARAPQGRGPRTAIGNGQDARDEARAAREIKRTENRIAGGTLSDQRHARR